MVTSRPAWVEIDMDAIRNNIREIRRLVGDERKVMAIIKANAYGHGDYEIADCLKSEGIDRFAVAILNEAVDLRKRGIQDPVMILGWTPPEDFERAIDYDITLCIFNYEDALKLNELCERKNKELNIHLKIDTGMSRIGFLPNEKSLEDISKILEFSNLKVEGIFTHFSKADEENKSYFRKQLQAFNGFIKEIEDFTGYEIPIRHCANSATIIECPDAYLDMVRPGIILYGLKPSKEVNIDNIHLIPALSLKARIARVEVFPEDTLISYGGIFKTEKTTKVATIPIGYADGYRRELTNKGIVLVGGYRCPVIGKVCMDQFMIDVTEVPDVKIGDEAIIIGQDGALHENADDLAEKLRTINYEVVCMLSERLPKLYKNN